MSISKWCITKYQYKKCCIHRIGINDTNPLDLLKLAPSQADQSYPRYRKALIIVLKLSPSQLRGWVKKKSLNILQKPLQIYFDHPCQVGLTTLSDI